MPDEDLETLYPCVGICMPDPDSGYCLGCGRPPLEVLEAMRQTGTGPQPVDEAPAPLRPALPGGPD